MSKVSNYFFIPIPNTRYEESDQLATISYILHNQIKKHSSLNFSRPILTKVQIDAIWQKMQSSITKYTQAALEEPKAVQEEMSYDDSIEMLKTASRKWIESAAKHIGISILHHKCPQMIDGIKAPKFDCIKYSFFVLKEPKVKDWLLGNIHIDLEEKGLINFLRELDYINVSKPRPNDLIIYFDKLKIPHHVGVVSEDPTFVQSKWGKHPEVFCHPINFIPEDYGCQYLVFRKKFT